MKVKKEDDGKIKYGDINRDSLAHKLFFPSSLGWKEERISLILSDQPPTI
jgi:hypothetical protein